MSHKDEEATGRRPVLASQMLGPALEEFLRQQRALRDIIPFHGLTDVYGQALEWQRIAEGLVPSSALSATLALTRQAQEIRQALAPLQLDSLGHMSAVREMTQAYASIEESLVPIDLSTLKQFRSMALAMAKVPTVDIPSFALEIKALDQVVLRATEVRAGIAIRDGATSDSLRQLVDGLDGISTALTAMWHSAETHPGRWTALPSLVREGPPLGYFEAVRSTGALMEVEEPLLSGPEIEHEEELADREIEPLVPSMDPKYRERYLGAIDAARQRGPDWFRHTSVSFRELFNDLTRALAPDQEVFAWQPSAPRDDRGSPTYAARLAFIFRDLGPEFAAFAELDNEHLRQTVIALNKGTHMSPAPFTEKAQRLTVLRAQFLVGYLLVAAQH